METSQQNGMPKRDGQTLVIMTMFIFKKTNDKPEYPNVAEIERPYAQIRGMLNADTVNLLEEDTLPQAAEATLRGTGVSSSGTRA